MLTGANDAWKQLTGGVIFGALLMAHQAYAEANPDITKRLILTANIGNDYVLKNPSFYSDWVKTRYNLTDASLVEAVTKIGINNSLTLPQWDSSVLSNVNQFLQLMKKYGIVKDVPSGFLTNAYNP